MCDVLQVIQTRISTPEHITLLFHSSSCDWGAVMDTSVPIRVHAPMAVPLASPSYHSSTQQLFYFIFISCKFVAVCSQQWRLARVRSSYLDLLSGACACVPACPDTPVCSVRHSSLLLSVKQEIIARASRPLHSTAHLWRRGRL